MLGPGGGGHSACPPPHRPALCEGWWDMAGNGRGLICVVCKASLQLKKKMEALAENEKKT